MRLPGSPFAADRPMARGAPTDVALSEHDNLDDELEADAAQVLTSLDPAALSSRGGGGMTLAVDRTELSRFVHALFLQSGPVGLRLASRLPPVPAEGR